jgi:CBS domain-containing protein
MLSRNQRETTQDERRELTMFDFDVRGDSWRSEAELLENLADLPPFDHELRTPIQAVPRRAPLILNPQRTLRSVVEVMSERQTNTALLSSYGVLLGVVTEKEILTRLLGRPGIDPESPAWMAMTTGLDALLETDAIGYGLRRLRVLGVRALPVVDPSGTLRGLFDLPDVVAWLCDRVAARTPSSGRMISPRPVHHLNDE